MAEQNALQQLVNVALTVNNVHT